MIRYVWLIPFLPLLAALINGVFGRKLRLWTGRIAVAAMVATFVISVGIAGEVISLTGHHEEGQGHAEELAAAVEHQPWTGETVVLWDWVTVGDFQTQVAFKVDQLTVIMLLFISFVGSLVFIYATGYMKEKIFNTHGHGHGDHDEDDFPDAHGFTGYDKYKGFQPDAGYHRFFAYLALFAGAMFTLVLGDNFLVMFVGWEGVGLCSYLLIGYYFDRPFESITCADAGKKAFVVNRIGDWGFILALFLIWWHVGSLKFDTVFGAAESGIAFPYAGWLVTAATLLLFLGATGKSAQIPLFIWLPDAMAGPTPVSALIHAATMVTAGVYMVARCNVLYALAPLSMATVAIIGALTAFVAASIGLTQRRIKKVLAYSTVSQLGFMFLGLGVGAFAAGIFHVFTHAFFKGCLFLAAGSVIHALHHEEDMFNMGGLRKKMKLTWLAYGAATLAIAGFPFTSGFFSKDEILWKSFSTPVPGFEVLGKVLWGVGVVAALFTAIYMGRSLFLTFHGEDRTDPHIRDQITESPAVMTGVLLVLGFFSLVAGFFNVPEGMGGTAWFHHFLSPVTDRGMRMLEARGFLHEAPHYSHGLELGLAVMSAAIAVLGLWIAWVFFGAGITEKAKAAARAFGPLYRLSNARWWWDDIYNAIFARGTLRVADASATFDRGVIDGILHTIARVCKGLGLILRWFQSGQVQSYALVMALGMVLFLLYFAVKWFA